MQDFRFNTVKTIINEKGGVAKIGELVARLGHQCVLVVADAGIVKAGHLDRMTHSLSASGIRSVPYNEVGPDPKESMVYGAVAKANPEKVDCVIGIGGGSVLDVAKAAAVLLKSGGSLEEIYGIEMVRGGRLPLILIPTTAGTGSEVTSSSVISHESGKKNVIIDPTLLPDIALLDVDLVSTMPQQVAITTGIDAIVHAIEAYTSVTKKNPISDMLACEALRYLMGNLEASVQSGGDPDAQSRMLLGSMLAGQAFTNASVSAVHAFAYALAEGFHLPHGLSNALVLLPIMKFNVSGSPEVYGQLAKAVFPELSGQTDAEAANCLIERLQSLLEAVALNKRLREFGIQKGDLESLAKSASGLDRLLRNNPRKIGYDDAMHIFATAF